MFILQLVINVLVLTGSLMVLLMTWNHDVRYLFNEKMRETEFTSQGLIMFTGMLIVALMIILLIINQFSTVFQ